MRCPGAPNPFSWKGQEFREEGRGNQSWESWRKLRKLRKFIKVVTMVMRTRRRGRRNPQHSRGTHWARRGSGASGDSGGLGGHKVPLCFIGSKRLRRVLHYLKNKRSHSLPTSSAASDSSGRVTVRHHPHDSHGTRTIRGRQRHPMRHELTDTHPSKTHEKTNTDILRTKSKNTRKVERSWIRV